MPDPTIAISTANNPTPSSISSAFNNSSSSTTPSPTSTIQPDTSGVTTSSVIRNANAAVAPTVPSPTAAPGAPAPTSAPSTGLPGSSTPSTFTPSGANVNAYDPNIFTQYLRQFTGENAAPTAPSLSSIVLGANLPQYQQSLANIQNAKLSLNNEFQAYKDAISGQGMGAQLVDAAFTAKGKQYQQLLDRLNAQESVASTALSNATNFVKTYMDAASTDYSNALKAYEDHYSQAYQFQQLFNAGQDEATKNASAFLTSVQNMAKTNALSWDKFSPAMQTSIQNAEAQAGYPPGFTKALLNANPDGVLIATQKGTAADPDAIETVWRNNDGTISVKVVSPNSTSINPGTGANSGAGYDGSILKGTNVDPQAKISDILNIPDQMNALFAAMTKAEGGSAAAGAAYNNPLDLKYTSTTASFGATDSGVKAQDGGTFAAFANKDAANYAYKQMLSTGTYKNLTVDQALQKWSGKGYSNTPKAIGTTGSPTINASAPGYTSTPVAGGRTQAAIDQAALQYVLTKQMPSIGLGSTGAAGAVRTAIQNRAGELDAGGNIAANKAILDADSASLKQQTEYLNNTQRAFNTANDTLDSLTSWMSENGINPSQFPDANKFYNFLKSKGIDPGAAGGYNAQVATLRQEYSQVLARGGVRSAETDAEAATLIPDGLAPADLAKVAERLKVDSNNAINDAQKQIDTIGKHINGIISSETSSSSSSQFQPGQVITNAKGQSAIVGADGKSVYLISQ